MNIEFVICNQVSRELHGKVLFVIIVFLLLDVDAFDASFYTLQEL